MIFFILSGVCFSNSYTIPESSGALLLGCCCSPNSSSPATLKVMGRFVRSAGVWSTGRDWCRSLRISPPLQNLSIAACRRLSAAASSSYWRSCATSSIMRWVTDHAMGPLVWTPTL